MSGNLPELGSDPRVSNFYELPCLPENRFHVVPYPIPPVSSQTRSPDFIDKFRKFFLQNDGEHLQFEGYWTAIQLYGGEEGLFDDLPQSVAVNFTRWCRSDPEVLHLYRNKARLMGYEYPDTSDLDNTVYARVKRPLVVSLQTARAFVKMCPQPRWIQRRRSHPASVFRQNWPGIDAVWSFSSSNTGNSTSDTSTADDSNKRGGRQRLNCTATAALDVRSFNSHPCSALPDDTILQSLRKMVALRQQVLDWDISWEDFIKQTEDTAAIIQAADGGIIIEDASPQEPGNTGSSTVTVSPSPEPRVIELPARLDAGTNIHRRKRALEDADPADGARPRPGPARWAAEFDKETALDMSRTLSNESRRLVINKTAYGGETWYVLAWGTQAAGMSAGIARAVQWIFQEHVEGSTRWSGLSLRFILKFSQMGQYAVVGKVTDATLSQETVDKLARGAYAGSLQMPIDGQARTAAAMLSRLKACGTALEEMMGLSVVDLITEGAAIDDHSGADILGGDPAEYMGSSAGVGRRAVSPGFIELE